MTYATLLVPVEAEPQIDHRLALAIDLANQFDARLIGVGAEMWRTVAMGGDFDVGYATDVMIEAEIARIDADLKQAEAKFRAAAGAVHQGTDWRSTAKFPTTVIAAEARAADLVVTSRSARLGASDDNVAAPGALVLQVGRPVLVAPPEADKLDLTCALVAWKDTREARRAVADALPLLKRAGAVVVAEVCYHSDAAAAKGRLNDVAAHLLRHGVQASTTVCLEETNVRATDQFLDLADRHKAGLIVAGAYGRSRFQEWVFGGFTRGLLAQTKRAVLLSH
jgi:nucleotide-binding universal stress UspA family protein